MTFCQIKPMLAIFFMNFSRILNHIYKQMSMASVKLNMCFGSGLTTCPLLLSKDRKV